MYILIIINGILDKIAGVNKEKYPVDDDIFKVGF